MPEPQVPPSAGVRVLDHAVLRVAAWPIEITDAFAAPALAAAARAVRADQVASPSTPAAAIEALTDRIHDAVPAVEDRTTRRWLLDVRRALVAPDRLVPPPPSGAVDALALVADAGDLLASIEVVAAPRAAAHDRRVAFADAFAGELSRSRHALRAVGGSDRFRTALAVAEPSVLVRWDANRDKPLSDKARVRRLESTVLHFAMRACGRPTPNGGWAGVTVVGPDADPDSDGDADPGAGSPAAQLLRVEDGPRAAHVSVDLAVFAAVLDAWARTLGAAPDHPLQREPTLRDELADGPDADRDAAAHQWVYLRRDTEPATFAALPTVPVLREALAWWPPGAVATPAGLFADLGEAQGRAVVEHLLASGVLQSALRLPSFAPSATAALAAVTPLLPGPLAALWSSALTAIGTETVALAAAFLADDVDAVVRHRDAAVAAVSELTRAAGLGDAPDRGLVHVDLQVPWRATWTAAGRAAIGRSLDDVFAFHAADGSPEAYRQVMAARVQATVDAGADRAADGPSAQVLAGVAATAAGWVAPSPAVATRGELLHAVGIDPAPAEARWTAVLDAAAVAGADVHQLVVVDQPVVAPGGAGPDGGGSVGAAPGATGSAIVALGAGSIWSRWGRPQPGMFLTRFAPLLTSEGDGGEPALASLAAALRRLGARRIVAADAPNPNAALRPALDGVDPWGWSLEPTPTDDVPVAVDPTGAVLAAADGTTAIPVYDSAAVIGATDPVSRFVRTAAMTHGWELASWGFPVLTAERERWPALPRIVLPSSRTGAGRGPTGDRHDGERSAESGTVLAARRWVVGGDALAAIRAEADEAERYVAWRAEVDRRAIPDRVIARWALVPDARELVLCTDNPLALRAMFDALPDGPATLVLTELPGPVEGWPVAGPEGHHLSELAVTWVRRSIELDPSVFPGGVVPPSFLALLDVLTDHAPEHPGDPDDPAVATDVHATLSALLDELVDPPDRAAVADAAAAWLTRVADAHDPGGPPPGGGTPDAGDAGASSHLRADLRSLRARFDADLRSTAPDPATVHAARIQLVARLGHAAALAHWGDRADRLRHEAALWRSRSST